jgi:hypothetical protein
MKNMNPFFVIGSVGMILTAVLHMVFSLILGMPAVNSTMWILYPTFVTFMAIGFGQILKAQLKPVKKKINEQ